MENCLSMDVEGFVESNIESFGIPEQHLNRAQETHEIEKNVDSFLDLLAELRIRGTFFIVGRIARDMPEMVRRVADLGHEIGCHNYEHRRIFGQQPKQFREGVISAKQRLGGRLRYKGLRFSRARFFHHARIGLGARYSAGSRFSL